MRGVKRKKRQPGSRIDRAPARLPESGWKLPGAELDVVFRNKD